MPRLNPLCVIALTLLITVGSSAHADQREFATGVVFHDLNKNQQHDPNEPGLGNIRVSNGDQVVATDNKGRYRLPVDDDTILFVIKPRDWMTPTDELNLPRFYYIHKPNGTPKLKFPGVAPTGPLPASIDFPLYRRDEPGEFRVLLFGDTQPYSIQEVDYLAHDIVEQLIGIDAAFGLTLGDIVGDDLRLFDPVNRAVAHVGIPFYNVLGNHDLDFAAADDRYSDDAYERTYGPPYYSFDYGPVHFIVLDSVVWHGATEEKKGYYRGGLGEDQLRFIKNDLAFVPTDQLIVLAMHIPVIEFVDRAKLFTMLANYPHTVSFSAHWHVQRHWFLDRDDDWTGSNPHHLMTLATTCGSWWTGAPDEVGIPHTTMRDGAPNGWCLAEFKDNSYKLAFRVARRPATYQMNIYMPEAVERTAVRNTEVVVNVFAGSSRSVVEIRVNDGKWQKLKRVERVDPYYAKMKAAEQSDNPPRGRKLPNADASTHLWAGELMTDVPPGTHRIEVRTTDMFDQTYRAHRLFRVTE